MEYTYTTEQLYLLSDIYINMNRFDIHKEHYEGDVDFAGTTLDRFITWLQAEDRTKLLQL